MAAWKARRYPALRPGTRQVYDALLGNHILPALGAARLDTLSPRMVQAWIDRIPATRRAEDARRLLGSILKDAVRQGLVGSNVVQRTDPRHREAPKRASFTMEEARALFAVCDRTRIGPMVRLAYYTGLRRGELCGLRWEDVSEAPPAIAVRRQVVVIHQRAQVEEVLKTRAARRTVPLAAQAVEALQAQKALVAGERRRSGRIPEDAGLVFPTRKGALLSPDWISRAFSRCVRRAGLEPRPFHALRHSAASLLLGARVTPELCAKIMGHANISLFYATYADLLEPAAQDAARQLEAFVAAQERRARAAGDPPVSANRVCKRGAAAIRP